MVRLFKIISCLTLISSVLGGKNGTDKCDASDNATKCDLGYYLKATDGKNACTACAMPTDCPSGKKAALATAVCNGTTTSHTANKTTAGQCVTCVGGGVDGKTVGKFANASGNGCVDCGANMLTCTAVDVATKCFTGYFMKATGSKKACEPCVMPATTVCGTGKIPAKATDVCDGTGASHTVATAANNNQCVTCVGGGDNGKTVGKFANASGDGCVDCGANMLTCSAVDVATKCFTGYFMKATGSKKACEPCVMPATTVCGAGKIPAKATDICNGTGASHTVATAANNNQCVACATNTGLYTGTADGCTVCKAGAKTCNATGALSCYDGYYLKTADKTCVLCDAQLCSQSGDADFCGTAKAVVNTTKMCANPTCNKLATDTNVVSDFDTCCKAAGGGGGGAAGIASVSLLAVIFSVVAF